MKSILVFRHFSQLPIEVFNGIRGVDYCPYLLRMLEIGRKLRLMRTPGFGFLGVFGVPFCGESIERIELRLLIDCTADRFCIGNEHLYVIVGNILCAVPYQGIMKAVSRFLGKQPS